jgi:putative FmdB family regulatory protein
MPTYEYQCKSCGKIKEVIHSIKKDPIIYCDDCLIGGIAQNMVRIISNNISGFIFKQWTESKSYKISRDKEKQNKELDKRQIERYGSGPQLKPNVAGMEVESWSDAKKIASEAKLNTSSYDPLITREKNISNSSGVDDRKWKSLKESITSY